MSVPAARASRKSLADEDETARKALFTDLRVQLGTIVFALAPPLAQVGFKRIHDARSAHLVLSAGWRVCSGQPGHGFPAQANALGNSSVAVSLGLQSLDLFVACPLTVPAGLLFTLHPRLRRRERRRAIGATGRQSVPGVVLVRSRYLVSSGQLEKPMVADKHLFEDIGRILVG